MNVRALGAGAPPRAAGIPTGKHGSGYSALDTPTKAKIDEALAVIQQLLNSGEYERLIFSKDKFSPTLGTGIFLVAEDVKKYIYDSLIVMKPS